MYQATDQFLGAKHVVIADMRGMKPLHPPVAKLLGEAIGYGRRNAAVLCAHVSDHTDQLGRPRGTPCTAGAVEVP